MTGPNGRHSAEKARTVEFALTAIRRDPQPGRRKLRTYYRAALAARDIPLAAQDEDLLEEMLQYRGGKDTRRAIGFALLHLLYAAPGAFSDPILSAGAERLWDDTLDDIYVQLGIHGDMRGADKRQTLMDAIPRAERALDDLLEDVFAVASASSLLEFRERYTALLAQHLELLQPFLPGPLTRGRLDQVFASIQAVFESDDASFLSASQRSWDVLRRFRDDAESFGTAYGRRFLAALAEGLLQCLETYRAERTLEPAEVTVLPGHKKYPLHDDGRAIRLALQIVNTASAPAQETTLVIEATAGVAVTGAEIFVGMVRSGTQLVEIDASVDRSDIEGNRAELIGTVHWRNADGSTGSADFDIAVTAQRTDVDWTALRARKPYRMTPVRNPDELIGRDQLIDDLADGMASDDMPSCTISGQKRIGKTSIVKSLETRLQHEYDHFVLAYLQVGKHRNAVSSLYHAISSAIVTAAKAQSARFPHLAELEVPELKYGFSDVLGLVDEILSGDDRIRFVLALDEFDEIPGQLYRLNDEAGAFFNTLRDLATNARASVILVGGENLAFALNVHASALNLLDGHSIGAFRREDQFADFAELVRRPTIDVLDFEPEAIELIYEEAAGHPYFAKMIAQRLFRIMTERRDSSVTASEVRQAVDVALRNASSASFSHFWDDGIFEVDPGRKQEVARTRRLSLLALARALRSAAGSTLEQLRTEAARYELSAVDLGQALSGLEQRGILQSNGDHIHATVPFFRRWLRDYGVASMIIEITDERARDLLEADVHDATISSVELTELTERWGLYRNRPITPDDLRAWLEQFGGVLQQRRALDLIKQLRFFRGAEMRECFARAHQALTQGWTRQLARGQQRFTDVLVVPIDEPGTIGHAYGSMYVEENRIHRANVVTKANLSARLRTTKREVGAVVFVDDFVATGRNVTARLGELSDDARARLREPDMRSALVVIAGFEDGIRAVEQWLDTQDLPIPVYPYELLSDRDRAFSHESRFFDDPTERVATQSVFKRVGQDISPAHPLGSSDAQALVVFESNVPNNTLPHLWAERAGAWPWKPLFERY